MATKEIRNPYDQSVIAELPEHSSEQVETIMQQAYELYHDRSGWLPTYERIAILERAIIIMQEQFEELVLLAVSEGGKPYVDSKVEVERAINGIKVAVEHISQLNGEQIPMGQTPSSANRLAFTRYEPIGVVVALSAFNHPLNLIIHQVVPAIAVGCPVVVKPAATTPLSCFRFVDILYQAGLPKHWCQALICSNENASKMAADPRTNFLSFIGSDRVGWQLRSQLAPGTRCALEHGGAAPVIIDQSADWDSMIGSLLKGGFYHAGQVCVSVQRIYVPDELCASFSQAFAEKASKLVVGDPSQAETEVGPLITPKEVDRVDEMVKQAKQLGGEILCGGQRLSDTCYAPTVILNPSDTADVSQHEIFGPVVCIYSYQDKQEAIQRANSLPVAFQASVFTKDIDNAFDMASQLNATAVMINDHTAFRVDWMPFGGRDSSGLGMGGIQYTMRDMVREKMFVIKSDVL